MNNKDFDYVIVCSIKSFENMVGKGEIDPNNQFLLFLSVF